MSETVIQEKNLSLGMALAYIEAEEFHDQLIDKSNFTQNDADFYRDIKSQFAALKKDTPKIQLYKMIPQHRCNSLEPFVKNNKQFFLAYIMTNNIYFNNEFADKTMEHLNNCYWCFETFFSTMQEYYVTSSNLISERIKGEPENGK